MKLEDEASIYWWSAALAEEAQQGVKGKSDRVEIGLRESRRPKHIAYMITFLVIKPIDLEAPWDYFSG